MRLQTKILTGFVVTFLCAILVSGVIGFQRSAQQQQQKNLDDARTLIRLVSSFSSVYQKEFSDRQIAVNEQTLGLIPAHATPMISREFTRRMGRDVRIGTVSDSPRNPANLADAIEQQAIDHFRSNPAADSFSLEFTDSVGQEYFLYAEPMRIEPYCLACHSAREQAPEVVRQRYSGAYDQQIDELRGILSIRLPLAAARQQLWQQQVEGFAGALLRLGVLVGVLYALVCYLVLRRVGVFQKQMRAFAAGDLDSRIPASGHDELGLLGQTFNELAASLSKSQTELGILEVAYQQSPLTIVITDAAGVIMYANPKFVETTGYQVAEVAGQTPRIFKTGQTSPAEYEQLWRTIKSGQTWRGEFLNRKKNGECFWERASISPAFDKQGRIQYYVAVKEDISELKRLEKSLNQQRHYDPLTGLPNENLLRRNIRQRLRLAETFALVVVNLDGFQKVNVSLGHAGGDRVIRLVGELLQPLVQSTDFLARLGADEFVLVLSRADEESVNQTCRRIISQLSGPMTIDGQQLFMTASLGVAFAPEDGADPSALRRNVFSALYRAKENGGNQICFFRQELNLFTRGLLERETGLRQALERQEFELFYQPQMHEGRVCGAEALLRWNSSEFGFVAPDQFIPLAEDNGLIVPVGQWVIETACRQAASWPEHLSVSVNVSARQFAEGNLVLVVQQALRSSGLAAHRLELEVTESLMQENLQSTRQTLVALASLGVQIGLDDFGTGYSSLSYLASLPFSVLKLDRSFVNNIVCNERDKSLCQAIVRLADALGLRLIAEGVEDSQQLELLQGWGVRWIQGYYYSQPLALERFLDFVEENS